MTGKCHWCGKTRTRWSDWEQQHLREDAWSRLCNPCATKRLRNPYSALLPMRKVTALTLQLRADVAPFISALLPCIKR